MNFEFSTLNPRRDGFTLLELLIVLSLVTLILGLSAIFFAGTSPANRLNAAARELSATLRYARALSQLTGEGRTVVIDFDAKEYGIEGRGYRSIPGDIEMKAVDPAYGELHQGRYQLAFRAAGGIPSGEIVLWNKKKEVKIELDPIVGTVLIK